MGDFLEKLAARYSVRGPVFERYEAPALLAGMAILLVIAMGVAAGIIGYNAAQLGSTFFNIALFWLGGLGAAIIGLRLIGHYIRLTAVFILLVFATAWASDILAVISFPYADDMLAAADARLFGGFDWPTMVAVVRPYTKVLTLLSYVYASLNWQPMLLLAAFCCTGKVFPAWRFLTAWGIALGFCLLVFPFCPAVGGYVHFNIAPETMPGVRVMSAWDASVLLGKLRSGAVASLDYSNLNGIITMPSFHAAASVLLAWGYGRIKWLRWPFLALNIGMLISAVPIGGHYLVDIVAGALVACLAILLANGWAGALAERRDEDARVVGAFSG